MTAMNHYVPVEVSKGMFSSEYGVSLKLITGKIITFFADKELIKQEENKYLLRVNVIEEQKDRYIVLLPSEAFETASSYAEVAR